MLGNWLFRKTSSLKPQAGHLGRDKTYHRAAISYYWPLMFKDITAFVRKYEAYKFNKPEQAQLQGLMIRRIV